MTLYVGFHLVSQIPVRRLIFYRCEHTWRSNRLVEVRKPLRKPYYKVVKTR